MAYSTFSNLQRACAACCLASVFTVSLFAARPSEELLPTVTKAYLSIPDMEALQKAWGTTQLGEMSQDPIMKPFLEDLQRQLKARLSQSGIRLGLSWDDLHGVAGGEVAVATIQPGGDKAKCATVLLANVAGHQDQLNTLLQKVSKDLVGKGAQKGSQTIGGVAVVTYVLPKKKPTDRQLTVYYVTHQDQLIVVDDAEVLKDILGRFTGDSKDTLKTLTSFAVTQKRSAEGLEGPSHVRWFVDPFGYAEVLRAYSGGRKKRGTDMLKVMANQGFNCVQGLGGVVAFSDGQHDVRHQSFVYAPAVKGGSGEDGGSKYQKAARMLNFPMKDKLDPQNWVPERLAVYLTFNWTIKDAFWQSESLINEVAGAEVFRDVLNDIEKDPNGPQINVDKEFVRYLGERVTVLSDYREPIDTKSERMALAIEVTDPQSVMAAVNKTMKSDRNAKKITVKDHIIWEMTQEEEFAVEETEIKIDGLDSREEAKDEQPGEEEEKRFRPNAAVTVAHGHFIIGTHVDYLVDILEGMDKGKTLGQAKDFQQVQTALAKLGSKADSFRCFTRSDQAYRVTYEMIRSGKMPEAETLVAKVLNEMLAPEDEESVRPQQIDGSKLPEFEKVQPYLGPTGFYVHSDDNGWIISGCVLRKTKD